MPHKRSAGDVLADRYRLVDLLLENEGGRFWRAYDRVLARRVAIQVIDVDDERAAALMAAAQRSSMVHDPHILRVLDADQDDEICYVVNEWGSGTSLDTLVTNAGPMGARRAAWVVAELADALATAHASGACHGRLNPENVLVDRHGEVRIIGLCVDAALHGVTDARPADDLTDLAGVLYFLLTTRWAGASGSSMERAPREHGQVLRPRRVRAGVPRTLDLVCEEMLHPHAVPSRAGLGDVSSAQALTVVLADFVGDPTGMPAALLESTPPVRIGEEIVELPPIADFGLRLTDDQSSPPVSRGFTGFAGPAALDLDPDRRPITEDRPTEAGVPIFDDDEIDVSWLARPGVAAPPPPPFDEHPVRPLFAPEPDDGAPARRPREGGDTSTGSRPPDEFWPFGADTGTGVRPGFEHDPRHSTGTDITVVDGTVPGRTSLRIAGILIALLLVALAVVVALNSGRRGDGADVPTRPASSHVDGLGGVNGA